MGGIRLETDRSEILMPSLSSSPWILGAPHRRLALAILRTRDLIALFIRDLPTRPLGRDLYFQNNLKPCRCQRTAVSGLTMIKTSRHLHRKRENKTQKRRSLG
jgi:hypothetical protein